LFRAGIFSQQIDEAKSRLKVLESSWRRFKREVLYETEVKAGVPFRELMETLDLLKKEMIRFYLTLGKLPMEIPNNEEVDIVNKMKKETTGYHLNV